MVIPVIQHVASLTLGWLIVFFVSDLETLNPKPLKTLNPKPLNPKP